ncbi:serine/threonine-protein kinase LMTK3-like [Lepus europaeus]|uniref:serine/threonine-protein kinase LMTK3-like n=1 Tax=Lepus europaeus TaxID=9983 RepID=UPI002B495F92|nr:serine/threonine-protein kinase LMTK3-like [Lepus europaeus]
MQQKIQAITETGSVNFSPQVQTHSRKQPLNKYLCGNSMPWQFNYLSSLLWTRQGSGDPSRLSGCFVCLREDFAIVQPRERAASRSARQHPSGDHRLDSAVCEGRGPTPSPPPLWGPGSGPPAAGDLTHPGPSDSAASAAEGAAPPADLAGRGGRPYSFGPAPPGLRPRTPWCPAGGLRVGLWSPRGVPAPPHLPLPGNLGAALPPLRGLEVQVPGPREPPRSRNWPPHLLTPRSRQGPSVGGTRGPRLPSSCFRPGEFFCLSLKLELVNSLAWRKIHPRRAWFRLCGVGSLGASSSPAQISHISEASIQ